MPATAEPEAADLSELTDEVNRANDHAREWSRRLTGLEGDVLTIGAHQAEVARELGKLREYLREDQHATRTLLRQILERLPPAPTTPTAPQIHSMTLFGAVLAGAAAAWKMIHDLIKGGP